MDSDEKNKPPDRTCEQCGANLKFIVALPRAEGLPTLNVHRCMICDNVVTESVTLVGQLASQPHDAALHVISNMTAVARTARKRYC